MTDRPPTTVVASRLEALSVALTGLGDHPEQVDIGPWRWSHRQEGGAIATWRHIDNWNRTVCVTPVSISSVAADTPAGRITGAADEGPAIEAAIEWMEDHGRKR